MDLSLSAVLTWMVLTLPGSWLLSMFTQATLHVFHPAVHTRGHIHSEAPMHKETEYASAKLIARNTKRSQDVTKCAFLHDDPRHPQPNESAEQLLVFYFVFAQFGPEYSWISTASSKSNECLMFFADS